MSNTTEHIKWGVVMQVKDEADVIEASVQRWQELGASIIYVIDDHSTDGTSEITWPMLYKYSNFHLVHYLSKYDMPKNINRGKAFLIGQGVNWIIPADADETWNFPDNNPGAFFASLPQMPSWGEVPYFDNFPNGVRRLYTHRKCFGYLTEEMEISIGNHLILGDQWPKIEGHGISIEHRPVRSFEQMKRKLINHWDAYRDAYPEHEHAKNYRRWREEGDVVFDEIWNLYNPSE